MRGFLNTGTRSFRFGDVRSPANLNRPGTSIASARRGSAGSSGS